MLGINKYGNIDDKCFHNMFPSLRFPTFHKRLWFGSDLQHYQLLTLLALAEIIPFHAECSDNRLQTQKQSDPQLHRWHSFQDSPGASVEFFFSSLMQGELGLAYNVQRGHLQLIKQEEQECAGIRRVHIVG